jgi:hypothetical protein
MDANLTTFTPYFVFKFLSLFYISSIKIIWEDRYERYNGSQCLVSVLDGTDYPTREPSPFNKKWYSHKMNGPGVRYKIAICIQTGVPVWTNGPYPCGSWPDLRIARHALIDALDPREYYIADGGYRDGGQWSVTPTGRHDFSDKQKISRSCMTRNLQQTFKYSVPLPTYSK